MSIIERPCIPPEWPDPPMKECPECEGVPIRIVRDGEWIHFLRCAVCHGTGQVESDAPVADRSEADDEAYHRSVEDKIGRGR